MAREPLYPLFPVCSAVTAAFVLFVLVANAPSIAHRSWNIACVVLFSILCLTATTQAINAVIWADNVNKPTGALAVYCDIWTHIQAFTLVSAPACTLVLLRRLYLIASLCTVNPWPTARARRLNLALEFILIFAFPAAGSGIFYTLTQRDRFLISERTGCVAGFNTDGFTILTLFSWHVIFPFISACVYCPRIIFRFYRQSRELSYLLSSNSRTFRRTYLRLMLLAVIDVFCVFPIGVINIVTVVNLQVSDGGSFPFLAPLLPHSLVEKIIPQIPVESQQELEGILNLVAQWGVVFEGCFIFAIFGFTEDALTAYRRIYCLFSNRKSKIIQGNDVDSNYIVLSMMAHENEVSLSTIPLDESSLSYPQISLPLTPKSARTRWSQASMPTTSQYSGTLVR